MIYASALRRFSAFFIDLFVVLGFYLAVGLFLAYSPLAKMLLTLPLVGLWFFGGLLCTGWLYYALLESSSWRATIGKRLLGLQVVNLKGDRISFLRATLRHIGKAISRLTAFLGLLLIFFTEKKQTLHDKIASTLVIRVKKR